MRWLLALVIAGAAAGADLPRPEVPDPYGLGERLALIDDLRERLKVAVPDGATDEQLVALWWANQPAAPALTPEQALARDRVQRLRLELRSDHGIELGEDVGEAELARRLAEARATRLVAAPTARAVAGSEVDDLRARIQRLGADVRAARARGDEIDARDRKLSESYAAEKAKLPALKDEAASHQIDVINALVRQHEDLQKAHAACVARADELESERNRCETRLAALASEAGAAAAAADPAATTAAARPAPLADTLEGRVKAAVVLVVVSNRGTGSGFFVTADGLLITNAHVVGKERQATALWDAAAKMKPVKLRVVQVDEAADLALLRAEGGGAYQPLRLVEAYDLSRPLLAAGYPLAGEMADTLGTSPSDIMVSRGILSSVRRRGAEAEWLQHDCTIASGSSGGPLLDAESGDAVGINTMVIDPKTAGAAGSTMCFAIPIRKAMDLFAAHLKR